MVAAMAPRDICIGMGNLEGRKFEVAKEELMGMFGSRRTKIGVSQRPPRGAIANPLGVLSDAG